MDNKERIYIVSFGDSKKYRFSFEDANKEYSFVHSHPLNSIENEIRSYLESVFPDSSLAYYYTPKVTEVEPEHYDRYRAYPPLDAKAIEEIKHVLVTEIRDYRSVQSLNNNAPYADAPV